MNFFTGSFIPPSLFLISARNVYHKFFFMLFFSITIVMWCHPCTCSLCVILARVPINGYIELVHSAPRSSPQKRAQGSSPENFLHTGGCFEPNTFRVQVPGWLKKKKEEKRKNSSEFRLFQVGHLKTATVDWGSLFTFCKLL